MKSILVPTDFSPLSDNALAFACQVAMQVKIEIFLLTVQSLPANDDPTMAIELIKTIEEAGNEKLKQRADLVESNYKGIKITTQFSFGIPSITVKEYLETNKFDLVVMGTRAITGVDRLLFGSVAESISKHSPCPVIIVHLEDKYKPVQNIAVPIDINYKFGKSQKIVQKVEKYAELFNAEIDWFYVNILKKDFVGNVHYMLQEGKKIEIEIVEGETVEKGITNYCKTNPFDLLIILKRDYTLVERLFHRNIFSEILQHQSLPIMVVHY